MAECFSKSPFPTTKRTLISVCFFTMMLWNSLALASGTTEAPGDNGLLIGSGRLHPYVQTEAHYVYNPHRLSTDSSQQGKREETQGPLFTLKPGAEFVQPSSTVQLKFNGYTEFRYYATDQLSDLPIITGSTNLSVLFNKESTLPIQLNAGFRRTDEPANQAVTYSITNNTTQFSADTTWKPSGGALSLKLKLPISYTSFAAGGGINAEALSTQYGVLDHYNLGPVLRIAWKFFPKTAVIFDTYGTYTSYPGSKGTSENMDFLGGALGLMGAITPKISMILKAGWAQPIFASDFSTEAQTFIGHMEIGYKINRTIEFILGVGREVGATPLFNFHRDYYGTGGLLVRLGSKLMVNFDFETRFVEFGTPLSSGSDFKARTDLAVKPTGVISYLVADWLTLSLHNRLEYRDTGEYTSVFDQEAPPVTGSYIYYDSFFRISARY